MNEGRRRFVGLLGSALGGAAVGEVTVHESGSRPPLLAVFEVYESLIEKDVIVDEKGIRQAWSDAFGGKPPCDIIVLCGGKLNLHYSEQDTIDLLRRRAAELEEGVTLTAEQYHHLYSFTKMFKGRISDLPKDSLEKT